MASLKNYIHVNPILNVLGVIVVVIVW